MLVFGRQELIDSRTALSVAADDVTDRFVEHYGSGLDDRCNTLAVKCYLILRADVHPLLRRPAIDVDASRVNRLIRLAAAEHGGAGQVFIETHIFLILADWPV